MIHRHNNLEQMLTNDTSIITIAEVNGKYMVFQDDIEKSSHNDTDSLFASVISLAEATTSQVAIYAPTHLGKALQDAVEAYIK